MVRDVPPSHTPEIFAVFSSDQICVKFMPCIMCNVVHCLKSDAVVKTWVTPFNILILYINIDIYTLI